MMKVKWKNMEITMQAGGLFLTRRRQSLCRAGGLIEVNSQFGQRYTNSMIKTMMWNYQGGK